MANYNCTIRTNYFKVKNEDEFVQFMDTVYGEDEISVWTETDEKGVKRYGFGTMGYINGCNKSDDDDDDGDYDAFIHGLSKMVADDDAVIIMESGCEKLRYVIGTAFVITSKGTKYIDATRVAIDEACKMLKNDEWDTQTEY